MASSPLWASWCLMGLVWYLCIFWSRCMKSLLVCFITKCTSSWSLQEHNYLCCSFVPCGWNALTGSEAFWREPANKNKRIQTDHDCISSVSLRNQDERSLSKITHIFHSWPRRKACQALILQQWLFYRNLLLHFPNIPRHVSRQRKIILKYL